MSKQFFPADNKEYVQTNRSNLVPFGNMWSTFGLDFQTNLGAMRVNPRLKVVTKTGDAGVTTFGIPIVFKNFDGYIWTIAGTRTYYNANAANGPQGAFVDDSTTSAQTDFDANFSDMEIFNGDLFASTNDDLIKKGSSSGGWDTGVQALQAGNPHRLATFNLARKLYVTNTFYQIYSINEDFSANTSGDFTIILSTDYTITCMAMSSQYVWLGILNRQDQFAPGYVMQWDGISQTIQNLYKLDEANGALAMIIQSDVPIIMDTNGSLQKFSGTGFEEVGRLPVAPYQLLVNASPSSLSVARFIHPRGLTYTKNGTVLAAVNNLNGDSGGSINENFASGIYEFDLKGSCSHRMPFTYSPVGGTSVTDYGQNRISQIGAIADANIYSTNASRNGSILVGAKIYTDKTNTVSAAFVDDTLNTTQKKGYFVTDFMESDEVEDKWERWWTSFRKFQNSTDSIIFKYRNTEESPSEGDITWVDTTHFTILNSAVNVSQYWTSGIGGEVEVLRGTGSGNCVHITNAILAGGTWTVTVDDVVTGVTIGTATARFQKWIKLLPELNQTSNPVASWGQLAIGANAPRIQVKCCMTFTGNGEMYKNVIFSNEDIKVTN